MGKTGASGAKGPQGPAGTSGASIHTSGGIPSGSCTSGDTDIDLANGEVYTCTASAWVDAGNSIKGAPGIDGTDTGAESIVLKGAATLRRSS